jgi:C-terminal processing protease CtpA/Prc
VEQVIKGSRAEAAGLLENDFIVSVGDVNVLNCPLDRVVQLLKHKV